MSSNFEHQACISASPPSSARSHNHAPQRPPAHTSDLERVSLDTMWDQDSLLFCTREPAHFSTHFPARALARGLAQHEHSRDWLHCCHGTPHLWCHAANRTPRCPLLASTRSINGPFLNWKRLSFQMSKKGLRGSAVLMLRSAAPSTERSSDASLLSEVSEVQARCTRKQRKKGAVRLRRGRAYGARPWSGAVWLLMPFGEGAIRIG